jgi:hypothetical protein
MMNRRNRLRRAALLLALLVLAAIITGVAASATTTVVPKQLTGSWYPRGANPGFSALMDFSPRGKIHFGGPSPYHAKVSRVTAHRLTVSGIRWCSGTGTYRWKAAGRQLQLWKIHDACKPRVNLFAGIWLRFKG